MRKGFNKKRTNTAWAILAMIAALDTSAQEAPQMGKVLVTGRRAESSAAETPQKIEVIDEKSIERTVSHDLTDLLKKNTGVDVIQYPGVLSGIGIRGFTPEFSGINKRTLLLIDGRPAGATNLGTIMGNNVERVEVLKGPASALYGASAMGGVVNVITRNSTGDLGGEFFASYGSFDTTELAARVGGKINPTFDFDYAGGAFQQDDDYKMGNGETLPNSNYKRTNQAVRFGANLNESWRLVMHGDTYAGRDIATPGDIAYGSIDKTNKDMDRYGGDIRLTGKLPNNLLSLTAYSSYEWAEYGKKASSNAADQAFLPFRTFESDIWWRGLQAQDEWAWASNASLIFGLDGEKVKSQARSFRRDGTSQAPFAADSRRNTFGVYAQNNWLWNQDKTAVTLGVRYDRIKVETIDTPLKTNFTPSAATFTTTNPSFGVKQELAPGIRAHATIGRGFVTPDSGQLTGANTQVSATNPLQTIITQGNPNLHPETSVTWDIGTEWNAGPFNGDITYFSTRVKDKIGTARTITPTLVVSTYENADSARMHGLELELGWQIAKEYRLSAAATRLFSRKEKVAGVEQDINVVADLTARLSLDVDYGSWNGRISARYVGERKDYDWVFNTGQIRYPTFTVFDLSTRYQFNKHHGVKLQVENLFDKFYFEKLGFPLPGRAVYAGYQYDF